VKSGDDHPDLGYTTGVGAYTDSDKTNSAWLVKVMKCRVGNIRIKRGRCKVWITICIEIIIIVIHITKMSNIKTKNKQINKEKPKLG